MSIDRSTCPADRHGTRTAYHNWGCQCADAREQERIALKRRREGRHDTGMVPAIGTARRLQSLVAAGHSQAELAKHLGVSDQRVHQLAVPIRNLIRRDTENRVRRLFLRLDGKAGGSRYARTTARRHGWVDAAAWDDLDDPDERPKLGDPDADVIDEVLVERVLGGQRADLGPANRLHAVATGRCRGMPLSTIGVRLRVSHTTVRLLDQQLMAAV